MDIDQPARPTSTLAALNQLKQSLPSQSTSSAKLHAFADVKPAADASNTFASIGNSLTALDSTLNASAGPPITGKTVATLRDYSSSFLSLANIQAGAKQASLDDQLLCYDFEDSTPLLKILRLIAERVGLDTHVEGDLVTLSASQVVIDAELSGKSVSKVTFVYNAEGKTDERLSSLLLSLLQDRDFRHVYVLLDDLARMDRQSASAGVDLFSERMRQVAQMETGEMLSSTRWASSKLPALFLYSFSPFGDVSYNLSLSKAVTFFYGPLFPYISFLLHVPAALPLRPEFAQAWSRRFSNAEDRELLNHPDVIWAGLIPDTVKSVIPSLGIQALTSHIAKAQYLTRLSYTLHYLLRKLPGEDYKLSSRPRHYQNSSSDRREAKIKRMTRRYGWRICCFRENTSLSDLMRLCRMSRYG